MLTCRPAQRPPGSWCASCGVSSVKCQVSSVKCGHVGMWACGHAGMWACGHAGMRACMHAYMHACMPACTHTHTHTHTHAHTRTHECMRWPPGEDHTCSHLTPVHTSVPVSHRLPVHRWATWARSALCCASRQAPPSCRYSVAHGSSICIRTRTCMRMHAHACACVAHAHMCASRQAPPTHLPA